MLEQFLQSLRRYANLREDDVKKGRCTHQFATSLLKSYSDSMVKAMHLIHKEVYIASIQSETRRLIVSITRQAIRQKKTPGAYPSVHQSPRKRHRIEVRSSF